jgi:hypothetical protein
MELMLTKWRLLKTFLQQAEKRLAPHFLNSEIR